MAQTPVLRGDLLLSRTLRYSHSNDLHGFWVFFFLKLWIGGGEQGPGRPLWCPCWRLLRADRPAEGGCARPGGVSTTWPPVVTCAALEHEVAVRLQVSSPKHGRCARGEDTSKVSVRQEGRRSGALLSAVRAHAFKPHSGVGCGSSRGCTHYQPGGLHQLPAAAEVAQRAGQKRCAC